MGADSGRESARPEGRSGPVESVTALDEPARIAALRDLHVLDTDTDPRFDRIVRLAAQIFRAPRAAVILIDEDRLWMKARIGLPDAVWPRRQTLVETVLQRGEAMFSGDVRGDPRFKGAVADSAANTRFYASAPLITPGGQIIGALSVGDVKRHTDPTPEERAALLDLASLAMEEMLRDAEGVVARERNAFDQQRVDLALEAAKLGAFEWEFASDRFTLNQRFAEMTGLKDLSLPADRGGAMFALVHKDDREAVGARVDEALKITGRYEDELRLVRVTDGEVVWASSFGVVVRWPDGSPKRLIGVLQDITARKVAEEQRETLVAELDHRVKNVLATVQSVAAQSARKAASIESFLKTFSGRLKSMASAHELLTATRWRGASLQNIATAELGGLAPGQTRWEGPDVLLTPRAANALSLALHELATNAVKFGALSIESGKVEVRWRKRDDGGVDLQWSESGGPPVSPPTRRGFGVTILEKVTGRELSGEARVEHRREGVRVAVTIGAAAIAVAAEPEQAEAPAKTNGVVIETPRNGQSAHIAGLRLLVVEDAMLLALELEAGLTEAGAIVVGSAGDLAEAMGMVHLDIDAAVLDANLNGESVRPVAEALAARGVPFVFATGYGDDKIMPDPQGAPVVRKPYDVTQIAAAIAEVTGRA
jgi:PAS domain S-box-containing protein